MALDITLPVKGGFLYIKNGNLSRTVACLIAKSEFPDHRVVAVKNYLAARNQAIPEQGPFDCIIAEFHFGRSAGGGMSGGDFILDMRKWGVRARIVFVSEEPAVDVLAAVNDAARFYPASFLAFGKEDVFTSVGENSPSLSDIMYSVIGDAVPMPPAAPGRAWWRSLANDKRSPT